MAENFGRLIALTVDTVRISGGLEVEFRVSRNLSGAPNTLQATAYNLARKTRAKIEALPKGARCSLEVGYETTGLSEIFRGDFQFGFSVHTKPEFQTHITATDGGLAQFKTLYRSYAKGTALRTVIDDLVKASELGQGNLQAAFALYPTLGTTTLPAGIVVSGSSYWRAKKLLNARGFSVSIQSNQIQIRKSESAADTTAFLLKAGTGLIGSPTIDNKKNVTLQCDMIADLYPGRQVKVESVPVNGHVDLTECEYVGSLGGGDFGINGKGKVR